MHISNVQDQLMSQALALVVPVSHQIQIYANVQSSPYYHAARTELCMWIGSYQGT